MEDKHKRGNRNRRYMINRIAIQQWSEHAPWIDNAQIEQDLIICRALVPIFSDIDKMEGKEIELSEWDGYQFGYFKYCPFVKWKLLNLKKLAKQNSQKLQEEAEKLRNLFNFNLNN